MTETRKLKFHGEEITLTRVDDVRWQGSDGTMYVDLNSDPGYPGLKPFETGKWDPFWEDAKPHDRAFNILKTNLDYADNHLSGIKVTGDFASGVINTMAKGAYAVVAGPVYLILGAGYGLIRWLSFGGKL